MAPSTDEAVNFYGDEKNLKALCDFLRSGDGPAVREAIEMDKRVYYLKGELFKIAFHCSVSPFLIRIFLLHARM